MHVSVGHGRCRGALSEIPGSIQCVVSENIIHRYQVVIRHNSSGITVCAVNRCVVFTGPYSASNVEYIDTIFVQCGCVSKAGKCA